MGIDLGFVSRLGGWPLHRSLIYVINSGSRWQKIVWGMPIKSQLGHALVMIAKTI